MRLKNVISMLLAMLCAAVLASCEEPERDQYGFEKSLTVSADGGQYVIYSDEIVPTFQRIGVYTDQGKCVSAQLDESTQDKNDSIVVTNEWLTVKYRAGDTHMVFISKENQSSKKRHLTVECTAWRHAVINVYQKGK